MPCGKTLGKRISPDLVRVRQGVPLRIVFDRQESGECTSRVVFPDFAVSRPLPAFAQTAVQLVPDRTGEFGFACGMNMVHGTLVVEPAPAGEHAPAPIAPAPEPARDEPRMELESAGEDTEATERRAEIADLTRRVAVAAVLTAPVLFAVMAGGLVPVGILANHWVQLALITPVMLVGNLALLSEAGVEPTGLNDVAERLSADGKTPLLVAVDGAAAGVLGVADTLKPESAGAVATLRGLGLQIAMITGDNRRTAAAIARQVGVERVLAEVLPDRKASEVRRLQGEGRRVAMVGDGINDAPALAQADIGMAIGTGTDVAIESSDITLISGALTGVVTAIRLSRATMRNIRQNLFFAFAYNVIGIPIAAGVLYPLLGLRLSPMIAAGAMALSSLSVVSNANRLRRFNSQPLTDDGGRPAAAPQVEVGAAEPQTAVDPVCGMEVDPASAAATASRDGTTYYFCSTGCRDHFLTDDRPSTS